MATVLIGPWCAGKSTHGPRLAAETSREFIDLDEIMAGYGAEVGWSLDCLIRRNAEIGMLASEREWEPTRVHAVERVLADFPDAVIALGASYTGYTSRGRSERVRRALSEHEVVLMTPSDDDGETEVICWKRAIADRGLAWAEDRADFTSWCPTRLDRQVADRIVLTG